MSSYGESCLPRSHGSTGVRDRSVFSFPGKTIRGKITGEKIRFYKYILLGVKLSVVVKGFLRLSPFSHVTAVIGNVSDLSIASRH